MPLKGLLLGKKAKGGKSHASRKFHRRTFRNPAFSDSANSHGFIRRRRGGIAPLYAIISPEHQELFYLLQALGKMKIKLELQTLSLAMYFFKLSLILESFEIYGKVAKIILRVPINPTSSFPYYYLIL